jgi:hypothetical protein
MHVDHRERFVELVAALTSAQEPVSFADAYAVVRQARRLAALDDSLVHQMVALHDAPQLTDGARRVLAEHLRALAQRLAQERALAARPLRPKDSGKTARAHVGAQLLFALSVDPLQPEWELASLEGPADYVPLTPATAVQERAELALTLLAPGLVQLEFTRVRRDSTPARRLTFTVIIEA